MKIQILFVLLFISILTTHSFAQLTEGEKDTIFVGKIAVQPSVTDLARKKGHNLDLNRAVEALDTQFTSALSAPSVFQLVDRKRIAELQLEQGFAQNSGMVDVSDKNAAQMGKMAGAKFAFLPQIDGFDVRSESTKFQAIGRVSAKRTLFISAVVQIVDTSTGKLIPDAPSIQLNSGESIELARMGTSVGSDQAIVALSKELSSKLSQSVIAYLRPAKVLTVMGKQIMINRGSESGFEPGKTLEFYATQDIKDDDSGEVFKNEVLVGKGIVERSDPRKSFATLQGEDLGVSKGVLAKLTKPSHSKSDLAHKAKSKNEDALSPGSSDKPLNF